MDFDPDGLHCHIVIPASQTACRALTKAEPNSSAAVAFTHVPDARVTARRPRIPARRAAMRGFVSYIRGSASWWCLRWHVIAPPAGLGLPVVLRGSPSRRWTCQIGQSPHKGDRLMLPAARRTNRRCRSDRQREVADNRQSAATGVQSRCRPARMRFYRTEICRPLSCLTYRYACGARAVVAVATGMELVVRHEDVV